MRTLRRVSVALSLVVVTIAASWTAMALLRTPFSGTEAERAAVRDAAAAIGVPAEGWKTLAVGATAVAAAPREAVWATFSRLPDWPRVTPGLVVSARWLAEPGFAAGARFEQTLALGFPLGTVVSREVVTQVVPGRQALWCKDEAGVASCHLWRFDDVGPGRTRIVNVEVLHGEPIGAVAPFVTSRWSRAFQDAASGLAEAAERAGAPPGR